MLPPKVFFFDPMHLLITFKKFFLSLRLLCSINYPHDYLQISGSMCHNCEEIFDYVIKLSESYRKDSEFQLVLKNFFFLLNNFFHF